jgi:hypothetical protein
MISGIEITASFATKHPTKKTGRQERVMRQMISGLVAAAAVMTVSATPASACGGLGLFNSCSPCGGSLFTSSCGGYGGGYGYGGYSTAYTASVAGYGYGGGCGGCGSVEALPELSPQYYHVNQGPTYTGPGNFAPVPTYRENAQYGWGGGGYGGGYGGGGYYGGAAVSYAPRPYYRPWRVGYGYGVRSGYRYGGYGVGRGYGIGRGYGVGLGRGYGVRHGMGYGGHRYGVARGYGVGRGYGHGMRRF